MLCREAARPDEALAAFPESADRIVLRNCGSVVGAGAATGPPRKLFFNRGSDEGMLVDAGRSRPVFLCVASGLLAVWGAVAGFFIADLRG